MAGNRKPSSVLVPLGAPSLRGARERVLRARGLQVVALDAASSTSGRGLAARQALGDRDLERLARRAPSAPAGARRSRRRWSCRGAACSSRCCSLPRRSVSVALSSKKRASSIDALALEQLADLPRVGALRDPHGDAARLLVSSWKGWKVALIDVERAADGSSASSATRRRNQRRGLGELGGSTGRPGLPIRCARAARLIGGRSATRRGASREAAGARARARGSGADRAVRLARPRRAAAPCAAPPAPRPPACAPLVCVRPLRLPARAPRLAAGGGTAFRPRPSRR